MSELMEDVSVGTVTEREKWEVPITELSADKLRSAGVDVADLEKLFEAFARPGAAQAIAEMFQNLRSKTGKELTHVPKSRTIPVVMQDIADILNMDGLLGEVRRLTSKRGLQRSLAIDVLKVSRSRVSEWLSKKGRNRPDGRNTLLLLKWVLEQRALEIKNRAGAQTPARRKTRTTESNEKPRPGPS
jgi:predicted XRE-type DNA-binding protein